MKDSSIAQTKKEDDKPLDNSKVNTIGRSKCGNPWKKGTSKSGLNKPFVKKAYD